MQRIALLGSTGSIGTSALDVISRFPERFSVVALSVHSNVILLLKQVKQFKPKAVCITDKDKARQFRKRYGKIKTYEGDEGLCRMIEDIKIDTLVVGIVGSSALLPILTALSKIKRIALANKEALVMAGDIIMKKARRKNVKILPVDSEHSAVFQCIASSDRSGIKKIYLTGSGGPFLKTPKKNFKYITPKEATNHPKWKMGKKISVDSATMMNKGLEVIEAHHLFGLGVERIEVLIHPETVIHSMVEFIDGSILAQMGTCDMRIPIQYALTYPFRDVSPVRRVKFTEFKGLHFDLPDFKKFPCLRMAYKAGRYGGTYPCVLNASNEVAVTDFLKGQIRFTDIPGVIEEILQSHNSLKNPKLEDILKADKWAREKTKEILSAIHS